MSYDIDDRPDCAGTVIEHACPRQARPGERAPATVTWSLPPIAR